jgi:hypothetical protein
VPSTRSAASTSAPIPGRARRLGGGLVCGAALAALLCGCNSAASKSQAQAIARVGAANRYLAQLSGLGQSFRAADARFAAATTKNASLPQNAIAAPALALARAADAYAGGVAALAPPAAAIQVPQAALVAVVRRFAADVRLLAKAARAGDPAQAIAAGKAASALAVRLQFASSDISTRLRRALVDK